MENSTLAECARLALVTSTALLFSHRPGMFAPGAPPALARTAALLAAENATAACIEAGYDAEEVSAVIRDLIRQPEEIAEEVAELVAQINA